MAEHMGEVHERLDQLIGVEDDQVVSDAVKTELHKLVDEAYTVGYHVGGATSGRS